ncbi:MAG TPA: hypothetical protein VGX50_03560, partial [Longimicrobium sp.]|nr:hypothetical protein [Longimicrobium sp.]
RGIQIPDVREDADPPDERERGAPDGAWWEAVERSRAPRQVNEANFSPQPTKDERGAASTRHAAKTAVAPRVDREETGGLPPPPRVIRIPFAPRAEDAEDAEEGRTGDPPPPVPSPSSPGEEPPDGWNHSPARETRPPSGRPTMRVSAPARPGDGWTPGAEAWAGLGEAAESTASFLARAARLAGRRARPAEEKMAPAPRVESAPSAWPAADPGASEPDTRRMSRQAVAVAEMGGPALAPAGDEWPGLELTELLDALASEIAHEYRRYYGE